jgi:sulfoxide reductase heme-binding subunit YedZ
LTPSWLKPLVFLVSLIPLGWYIFGLWMDALGANPIEAITRGLGAWTLNFLFLTLLMSPLKRYAAWRWPLGLRRMLGLFTFFYASLHLLTYLWLDRFFDWPDIAKDILKRPFITAGMSAYLLLVALAATSNARAMRMLGGKRWQRLHWGVYPIGVLGVMHYLWLVKADVSRPLIYALLLAILLGSRVVSRLAGKVRRVP